MKSTKTTCKIAQLFELFLVSMKLGLISFGGPTAHLSYFHHEYVEKRKWLNDRTYADLVALAQFLPGPASSQVGIGIGVMRSGWIGGIISFIGFTFPSVIAMILFATYIQHIKASQLSWILGLKIVALAIVAHVIIKMATQLLPNFRTKLLAFLVVLSGLLWPSSYSQIVIILMAAIFGYIFLNNKNEVKSEVSTFPVHKKTAIICLTLFFSLLIMLPILQQLTQSSWITMVDRLYRTGSLVFGGGHIVLPLLEEDFVSGGWINKDLFITGYGAVQAVPGPLFTFAAYIGTIMHGILGGILATIAIFTPSFLLIVGILPFWNELRKHKKMRAAVSGINAAVVGILIIAFYDPIWTSSITTFKDFFFSLVLFCLFHFGKVPAWAIVILGMIGGWILYS